MTQILVAVAVVFLSGCGAGVQDAPTNPTPAADRSERSSSPEVAPPSATPDETLVVSAECIEAFGEMLDEVNEAGSVESRMPAMAACASLDAWVAAAEQHPELVESLAGSAWDEPIAALYLLGEVCAFVDGAGEAPLCVQLAAWCDAGVEHLSQPPCQVERPMGR